MPNKEGESQCKEHEKKKYRTNGPIKVEPFTKTIKGKRKASPRDGHSCEKERLREESIKRR